MSEIKDYNAVIVVTVKLEVNTEVSAEDISDAIQSAESKAREHIESALEGEKERWPFSDVAVPDVIATDIALKLKNTTA